MAQKTATILTRTEPETKAAADELFAELGTSTSGAINIFLHQAVKSGGFPFRVTIAKPPIPDLDTMSNEEINQMIMEARDNAFENGGRPAKEVFADLKEKYALA